MIKTKSSFQTNLIIPIKSLAKEFILCLPSFLMNGKLDKSLYLTSEPHNITAEFLQKLWEFILQHPFEHHRHRYGIREHTIAAVMSCGKNFAVWIGEVTAD